MSSQTVEVRCNHCAASVDLTREVSPEEVALLERIGLRLRTRSDWDLEVVVAEPSPRDGLVLFPRDGHNTADSPEIPRYA